MANLWKYVGYLIGIPVEIIPNNKKEATEYFYNWTAIQPASDNDSTLLAKSLLDENLELLLSDKNTKLSDSSF